MNWPGIAGHRGGSQTLGLVKVVKEVVSAADCIVCVSIYRNFEVLKALLFQTNKFSVS